MKTVKKLAALILCVALVLSCFAGCHEKNATVASITLDKEEYTVPAGLYLTMLINADSEARSIVAEKLDKDGKDTTKINFSKQTVTVDKKDYKFNDYVIMRAKEMVAEYLVTAHLFTKFELALDENDVSALQQYAAYQWMYNGSAYLFEPNGVSYESFEEYLRVNMYWRSDLFDYYYNEGGEKAPEKANIEKALKEHFTAAQILEISVKNDEGKDLAEDKLTAIADKIQAYCDRINGGTATFADIKAEYEAENKKEEDKKEEDKKEEAEEDKTEEESKEETKEEEEKPKPKDETISIIGNDETSVASDNYEKINELEVGKATLLKGTDGYYRLVIKQDIMADEYYYTTYRDETVRIMHAEDFNEFISKEAAKLKVNYDSYELNYLKPGKVSYDEYNAWYSSMLTNYQ